MSKPISRGKILFSKFLAGVISANGIIAVLQILGFLALGMVYGFESPMEPVIAGTKYVINASNKIEPVLNSSYIWTIEKVLLTAAGMQILFVLSVIALNLLVSILSNNNVLSLIISFTSIAIVSFITFLCLSNF